MRARKGKGGPAATWGEGQEEEKVRLQPATPPFVQHGPACQNLARCGLASALSRAVAQRG